MKKAISILIIAVFVIASALSLTSCSKNYEGTWTVKSFGGKSVDLDIELIVNSDNTGKFVWSSEKVEMTFKIDGDNLIMNYEKGEGKHKITLDGDTLTIEATDSDAAKSVWGNEKFFPMVFEKKK